MFLYGKHVRENYDDIIKRAFSCLLFVSFLLKEAIKEILLKKLYVYVFQ